MDHELYQLAVELKAAGFPQGSSRFVDKNGRFYSAHHWDESSMIFCPTLEKIIDECGGKNLKFVSDQDGHWCATSSLYAVSGDGPTSLIAAGELWLAINSKA